MSDVEIRKKTEIITEIVVPCPTDWTQLSRALHAAGAAAKCAGIDTAYDDAVLVRSTDDEIILYFSEPGGD